MSATAPSSHRPSLRAVFHSSFTVSNMERSLEFYRDILGMAVVVDQVSDTRYVSELTGLADVKLRAVYLELPGDRHRLELLEYIHPRAQAGPTPINGVGGTHLCFYVDDLQAVYEAFSARGVEFVSPPVDIAAGANTGARGVYLRDPDGITLELHQPAAPA
jgi:catechol 2,3-dioxygenase-like lactoylglutathione lyase family enzyme